MTMNTPISGVERAILDALHDADDRPLDKRKLHDKTGHNFAALNRALRHLNKYGLIVGVTARPGAYLWRITPLGRAERLQLQLGEAA